MRRSIQVALVAMLCVLTTKRSAGAASRWKSSITVTDKSGASIQDARVTVTNEGTNVAVTVNASSAGTYVYPNFAGGLIYRNRGEGRFPKSSKQGRSSRIQPSRPN